MEQELVWENQQPYSPAGRVEQNWTTQPGPHNETMLIQAAQAGNLSAFNQIVLSYQDDLFAWAASLVHDDATADDITQMTFVTAYQKINTFRGGSLRAWLFQIAKNRSIDHMRYQKRRPTLSLDGSPEDDETGDLISILPADVLPPEEAAIQAEQSERLGRLLNSLPEAFRHVLQLVDMYGMDYQEAADALNLPLGTLKSRLVRARVKLRDLVVQDRNL